MFSAFLGDRRGNFAIIAALAMVPLIGAVGLALDYSRGMDAQTLLQDRADAAALSVAKLGPASIGSALQTQIIQSAAAESGLQDVVVNARWTSLNEYTVTISGNMPLSLSQVLPGTGARMPVSVQTVARYKDAARQYKPPTATLLDPEAGDYNRIFAYCFNKDKKGDTRTYGRTSEVAIADNAGTPYKSPMPTCGVGETMSFRLYNVRGSRTVPSRWDDGKTERYDYYTDTELRPAETYDLGGWAILETVLCPSYEQCKPTNQGGVLPYGKNRTPQRATAACSPGKFMYYGWEDRPPGRGSSDRDYDDIRVIIECAAETIVGDKMVRLIR